MYSYEERRIAIELCCRYNGQVMEIQAPTHLLPAAELLPQRINVDGSTAYGCALIRCSHYPTRRFEAVW